MSMKNEGERTQKKKEHPAGLYENNLPLAKACRNNLACRGLLAKAMCPTVA